MKKWLVSLLVVVLLVSAIPAALADEAEYSFEYTRLENGN